MKKVYVVKRCNLEVPIYVAKSQKEAELVIEDYRKKGLGDYDFETKIVNDELYSDLFRPTIKFN